MVAPLASRRGIPATSAVASAPVAAVPAWRNLPFFTVSPSSSSPAALTPSAISCLASTSSGVLLADQEGLLHCLDEEFGIERSWRAYTGGRCDWCIGVGEGKWSGTVLTIGSDSSTPYPLLKIWTFSTPAESSSKMSPTLLLSSTINPHSTPHPVSALSVAPDFSHIVIGLANGSVVAFKGVAKVLEEGGAKLKLRVLFEGKEPITGLGFAAPSSRKTPRFPPTAPTSLFITTTSSILSLPLSNSKASAIVIDSIGADIGCSTIVTTAEGDKLCVAREEAVYLYGSEGREGCFAFEGPKSGLYTLTSSRSSYIAIITPPTPVSLSSTSGTIRSHARSLPPSTPSAAGDVGKVTIFEMENRFVGYSGTFEGGVKEIFECWDSIWVLSENGKIHKLTEQPLATSLSTLFSKNLYTLAISLAHSRGLPPSEVAEIYRRYGDHLYSNGDFEGAMGCYLKTVGSVQASYVIRKFLDAQRLSHLTSYLQELHARGLANSDHTTLLLNCYTKLSDDTALSSFIHSSSTSKGPILPQSAESTTDEPSFDLETAIRVCRQAGYFEHAVWLAQRYGEHQEYLRIQIEDRADFVDSLRYLRKLGVEVAEDNLLRYGKNLLAAEPAGTTQLLVDLCCGTLEREDAAVEVATNGNGRKATGDKGYMSYLSYAIPGAPQQSAPSPSTSDIVVPAISSSPLPRSAVNNLRAGSISDSPVNNRRSGISSQYSTAETLPPASIEEDLPSPRQFFAHFVDHPHEFINFLEAIASRRYGKQLDIISPNTAFDGFEAPLGEPRTLTRQNTSNEEEKDEQAVWNALLELYLSHWSSTTGAEGSEKEIHSRSSLQSKALQLLRARDRVPYDETQALLVCTASGFTPGVTLLYEQLGMYDDIVRFWIDSSRGANSTPSDSNKVIQALRRYGSSRPYLYRMVLRYLTTSSELLSRHQGDIVDILEVVEREKIIPPIAVIQILSANGTASMGLVREYLKRQLTLEKQEIESDQSLITSYRTESAKKQKEIQELSDPDTPRIFQVTRCSSCGGQLDLPSVHFMCRHSYHQRCLPENESQCPNCARSHGVIREIRKNNEQFAGRHDLFLSDVRESEDGYKAITAAYGKGLMAFAVGDEA